MRPRSFSWNALDGTTVAFPTESEALRWAAERLERSADVCAVPGGYVLVELALEWNSRLWNTLMYGVGANLGATRPEVWDAMDEYGRHLQREGRELLRKPDPDRLRRLAAWNRQVGSQLRG